MLDPALRPLKDRLLNPLAVVLASRAHPNTITLLGFGVGLGCAAAAAQGAYGAALALWAANRTLDGLDGAVARIRSEQTDLGGYLDLLLDFVLYAFVPLALAYRAQETAVWSAAALLLATFYVNAASWMYLAAVLEKRSAGAAVRGEQTAITMPTGLIEGTETIVFYTFFLLFPAALAALFGAMALLVWVTVAQRLLWAIRHL